MWCFLADTSAGFVTAVSATKQGPNPKALHLNFHANRVAAGKHNRRKFAIQTKSLKEGCSFIRHTQ
jgi:hypothetical protein